ncbi:hypothetical protein RQP46_008751 [Phenoliferia psychrophenolica]
MSPKAPSAVTSDPEVVVLPALLSDVPAIVALHYRAVAQDPLYLALFGKANQDQLASKMQERTEQVFAPGDNRQLLKAVRGGELVGFAQFARPKELFAAKADAEGSSGKRKEHKPSWADGVNIELAVDFFDRMGKRHEAATEPHCYLQMLAVDPAARGIGCGRLLVSRVVEEAEQSGFPVFLDSSNMAESMYRKLGFVEDGDRLWSKDFSFSPMTWRKVSPAPSAT